MYQTYFAKLCFEPSKPAIFLHKDFALYMKEQSESTAGTNVQVKQKHIISFSSLAWTLQESFSVYDVKIYEK